MVQSLTFRITWGTTLGFLLSSVVAFLFLDHVLKGALNQRTDQVLETLILDLSSRLAPMLPDSQPEFDLSPLQRELEIFGLTNGTRKSIFRVLDATNHTVAQSDTSHWPDLEKHPKPHFTQNHPLFDWTSEQTEQHPAGVRLLAMKMNDDYSLQIGLSLEDNRDMIRKGQNIFGMAIGLILIIGISGSIILTRKGLLGLKSIGKVAQVVRQDLNFNQQVSLPTGCSETDQLAQTFNLMLNQIQLLIQSQKDIMDNIAHDVRSPVARLRVMAETQLMKDGDLELAGRVVEGCDQILDLINTLLEISATESGTAHLAIQPLDMEALAQEACELLSPLAELRSIRLNFLCGKPAWVLADERLLQRVIANLIDNAIKYSPEDTSIEIEIQARKETCLSISDQGPGIPEKDLDRIFDRFIQLDTARGKGNGLGLSFCKAAMQAMGGRISCRSVFGNGSTFEIHLKPSQTQE